MLSFYPWVLACGSSSARCRRCWLAKVRGTSASNSSHDGIDASWFSYQVRATPCKAKYTFRRRCSTPHPLNRATSLYWLNQLSTSSWKSPLTRRRPWRGLHVHDGSRCVPSCCDVVIIVAVVLVGFDGRGTNSGGRPQV
uniref:Uncharacterized protein n=1 Tax=Ixodes ricinus TaxID=34613 RepID=A0A6B0USV6_IXORI